MEVITQKKRDRVPKACTNCRRKKIKCDGRPKCQHCSTNMAECIYPSDTIRKPRAKKTTSKVTKSNSIKSLDSRLARLEGLIQGLATKLEGGSTGDSQIGDFGESVIKDETTSSEDEDAEKASSSSESDYKQDGDYKQDESSNGSEKFGSEKFGSAPANDTPKTGGLDRPTEENHKIYSLEKYYGTHCTFHIFSEKSIAWIKSRLRPQDTSALYPLENLPFVFTMCNEMYNSLWTEPQPSMEHERIQMHGEPFFDNPTLGFELLKLFDSIFLACYLCDVGMVKNLLKIYYSNKGLLPDVKGRKLKYSELLVINASLALCITVLINKRMYNADSDTPSSNRSADFTDVDSKISAIDLDTLVKLQEKLFKNCIFYFGRISIISEGFVSIQAILLLVIYLETNLVDSHVNYMLSTVAVRFAQEIGLHRFESFQHLSPEERSFRRRIWWFCQYFDMEICYRNGKPPLVDDTDVSSLTSFDSEYIEKNKPCDKSCDPSAIPPECIDEILKNKEIHNYTGYYLMNLTRIRARSYKELFSASVQNNSFKGISTILNRLNQDMRSLADSIDPRVRPRFYNDPGFDDVFEILPVMINGQNVDCAQENVLTLQLTYFLHSMTINKLAFQIVTPGHGGNSEEGMKFRTLTLDSARTILHMILKIKRRGLPLSFVNWIIFFPFAAFLNILGNCIHKPSAPESMRDVGLLIDVAVKFFAYNNRYIVHDSPSIKMYHQRESVVDLTVRIMLGILIKVMEAQLGVDILEGNENLQRHLSSAERDYPDIFRPLAQECKKTSSRDPVNELFRKLFRRSPEGIPQWKYGPSGFITINTANESQQGYPSQPSTNQNGYHSSPSGDSLNTSRSNTPNYQANVSNMRGPSLSNILQPPDLVGTTSDPGYKFDPSFEMNGVGFKNGDALDDDSVNNFLFSQLNELPNFFFDNGL